MESEDTELVKTEVRSQSISAYELRELVAVYTGLPQGDVIRTKMRSLLERLLDRFEEETLGE